MCGFLGLSWRPDLNAHGWTAIIASFHAQHMWLRARAEETVAAEHSSPKVRLRIGLETRPLLVTLTITHQENSLGTHNRAVIL